MKHALRLSAIIVLGILFSTSLHGQSASPALRSGLIAWLQLDEVAGEKVIDASGSGHSATIVNGSSGVQPGHLPGSNGLALSGTKYLSIPLKWQPTRFTVSWWVAPNSRAQWTQAVMANGWGSFLFHTSPDGKIYVGTDLENCIATDPGVFELNSGQQLKWQLYTFTFERNTSPQDITRGTGKLYKGGQLIALKQTMALPQPWSQLKVGSSQYDLAADGIYDDIRVYDRALSSSEVTQLATSTDFVRTPKASGSFNANLNWSLATSYDGEGNIVGESKGFADAMGRPIQSQLKSQTSGHVLASQVVYNMGGKGALSTLPAPIDNLEFRYEQDFATIGGNPIDANHIEQFYANNLQSIDKPAAPGSVGYYYSTNNTLEPLTATTNYPFSLVEEYAGPSGGTKRASAPGDLFQMGGGKESKSREFALLNELDHYLSLRPQFVGGTTAPTTSLRLKGEKSVSVNTDGLESISFMDSDGRSLASCLSGSQYPGITLEAPIHSTQDNSAGIPVYQDIHVPAAGPVTLAVQGGGSLRIVNLLTDATVGTYAAPWPTIQLAPGFYRLISESENQIVRYQAHYGQFSYSYYDDAGRVVATIAPNGVEALIAPSTNPLTERVGHWSLDEGSGTTTADRSGNELTGMLVNQPVWMSSSVNPSPIGGEHLVLNGQNQYVRIGDAPALRLTNKLSFEAWIYPTGNQVGMIVNKENEYEIARFQDGYIYWAFQNASPGWAWVKTDIFAPLNTWSHIGLTYDNGVVNVYLNGNQVGATYNGSGPIGYRGGEFWIGGRQCCGEFFKGEIDDVRMWNSVHAPSPTAISTNGKTPFATRNTYSGAGTLLAIESTDEGRTQYVYARDGRIRFSQSALQKQQNRFSYTNYDQVGRVLESGEYTTDTRQGQSIVFEDQLNTAVTDPYEAESALFTNGGRNYSTSTGARGSGFVDYLIGVGNKITFRVTLPTGGVYAANVRYSAGANSANRTMTVLAGGVKQQVVFASTNSWSNWAVQTVGVSLPPGTSDLTILYDTNDNGYVNIDYIDIIRDRPLATTSVLTLLEDRTRAGGMDEAGRTQRTSVWYDMPEQDPELSQWLGRTQEFVLGAVAKTSNGTNSTWYSYDDQGRITWLVQDVAGVGKKSVDYSYDFLGNVLEVAYQKGKPDAFYHHYEYDADKRLRSVYTSLDGQAQNRALQARYFYYLHGPLKRVELADRLQGLDYTYTIQGWLKSINNAQKSLDPGQDGPKVNGVLKDLFGMRLDYFNNDYVSRQITANSPFIQFNQGEIRYDGTVRANSWQTAAADKVHAYAYRYDAKGQLLESVYGQLYGGNYFSSTNTYGEGNLSYDTHGNILSLRRYGDKTAPIDDFAYQYTANTNKLAVVKNQSNQPVLNYEYDVTGQMTRESEVGKADKHLRYDVTGKVTGVYRDAAQTSPLATYAYNDRGFRVEKIAYSPQGVVLNTTTHVRDAAGNVLATYELKANNAVVAGDGQLEGQQMPGGQLEDEQPQLIELPLYGSSRLGTLTRLDKDAPISEFDAQYELNDQLGNARVVFHRPKTVKYVATMEDGQRTAEEKIFANLPATRSAAQPFAGAYSAQLVSGGQPLVGPSRTTRMQKGDTITFSAMVHYQANGFGRPAARRVVPYAVAGAVVAGIIQPAPPLHGPDGQNRPRRGISQVLSRLTAGIAIPLAGRIAARPITPLPPVYLRYRLYDSTDNRTLQEGSVNVSYTAGSGWEELKTGLRANEGGKLELTTVSAAFDNYAFFDNITVEHTTGAIVQEQHQYAFGSPLTGLNYVVGNKRYRHGYQGQFTEKDEETGYDSFELRLYNSRIGRWMAPDPEGQHNSPYLGMGNNPIARTDPDGGYDLPGVTVTAQRVATSAKAASNSVGALTNLARKSLENVHSAVKAYGGYAVGFWSAVSEDVTLGKLDQLLERRPLPRQGGAIGFGQTIGHGTSAVLGAVEATLGFTGEFGGGVLSLSGGGVIAGAPAIVAGTTLATHGTLVTGTAMLNMSKKPKQGLADDLWHDEGKGGRPTNFKGGKKNVRDGTQGLTKEQKQIMHKKGKNAPDRSGKDVGRLKRGEIDEF